MDNQNIFYQSLYNEEIYVLNETTKSQPLETSMEENLPDKAGLFANTLVVVGPDHSQQNDFLSKILGLLGRAN